MLTLVTVVLLSYLLGSIPTSIIVGKVLRGIDIREYGSGNAGATNTFRVLGLGPAIFVGLVDVAKGICSVLLIVRISIDPVPMDASLVKIIAGAAAICGHIWTVFAGFRGGKAVNTALGVLIALAPIAAAICFGIWLAVTFSTRYVSMGSMSAALALPVVIAVQKFTFGKGVSDSILAFACLTAVLIVVAHRSNIGRLLKGQENRFGSQRKKR